MKDFLNSWGISLMVFLPLVGALAMLVVPKAKEQYHKVVALAASLDELRAPVVALCGDVVTQAHTLLLRGDVE